MDAGEVERNLRTLVSETRNGSLQESAMSLTKRICMEVRDSDRTPVAGHMIQTVTKKKAPTVYLIVAVRQIKRRVANSLRRFCLDVHTEDSLPNGIPAEDVWSLQWFPRTKR